MSGPDNTPVNEGRKRDGNGKLVVKLLGVSVAMFGFGVFVMPPLYETFCEITGLNQGGIKIVDAAPEGAAQDRTIKIRFDANKQRDLQWESRFVMSLKRLHWTVAEYFLLAAFSPGVSVFATLHFPCRLSLDPAE